MGVHGLVQGHPLPVGQVVTHRSEQFVRRASIAASAGLVLALVATAGYIAWPRVAAAMGVKPAAAPAYAAGEQVDVPAAWYNGADTTLIVFARASCAACEKAQPFLAQMVARMQGHGAAVMAHPPGMDEDDRQFARRLGIADNHIHVVGSALKVRATPTMLIVNRQGRILNAWEGARPEHQAAMLTAVDAATR